MNESLRHSATHFHALHHDPSGPLLLSNAWDVASARIIEAAGAPAIATTSAGIAWALGYADGNRLPRDVAIAAIRRIAAAVSVPVTADLEAGYADDADGVERTVAEAIDAGVVGINLEDGRLDPADCAARIAGARRAANRAGVPLFINARTDVALVQLAPADPAHTDALLAETTRRAARYLDAGADGVFVPGVTDLPTIGRLAEAIAAPLNVMTGPGAPDVSALHRAGAARPSLGSGVAGAAYAEASRVAAAFLGRDAAANLSGAAAYATLNALFEPRAEAMAETMAETMAAE